MSPSAIAPAGEPQIATLTALRFFAAAWVVLYAYWPNLDVDFTPNLVGKGYLGVELFFVLSGFVISHVYQAAAETGRLRYGAFLWARLARVYPLHLATLAAVLLMGVGAGVMGVPVGREVVDPAALPANLALVHAWGFAPSASFNHPSWSISAEWFAYLTFPVFAAVAARLSNRPGLAVVGALALLFGLYAIFPRLTGFPLTQATIAWGALRIVPCFALGCAVHLLWRSGALSSAGRARMGAATFGLAIVGLAAVSAPAAFLTASFAGLIISLAALWTTRTQAEAPGRTLSIFSYLGEISYSTYMICVPWKILSLKFASIVLGIPGETLPLGLWLIFLVSLVPLSALSFHLVERPARAWMKHRVASARGGATFQPAS